MVSNASTILLLFACLVAAIFLRPAFALAGPLPFSINPVRMEFVASPGEHKSGSLMFRNGSSRDVAIKLEGADFQNTDELGHVAIGQAEASRSSLKDWIRPMEPAMTVAAGATAEVDFSLEVPSSASPGGHWGALVLTSDAEMGPDGLAEQTAIALIVLANVRGENEEKVSIASFSAPHVVEAAPIALMARFKNEGTLHERPHAVIEIRNIFGRVVASGVFSDEHVLPGAIRRVERSFGAGFWFGRYTARLTATYADGTKTVEARVVFRVVPWKKVLPVGLGIVVVLAGAGALLWWRRRVAKG